MGLHSKPQFVTTGLLVIVVLTAPSGRMSAIAETPDFARLPRQEAEAQRAKHRALKRFQSALGARATGYYVIGTSETTHYLPREKPGPYYGTYVVLEIHWEFHVLENREATAEFIMNYLAGQYRPRTERYWKLFGHFDKDELGKAMKHADFLRANPLYAATRR